jgi:hypothetical protein
MKNMKKIVIFVNGNYVSAIFDSHDLAQEVFKDLMKPLDGGLNSRLEFQTDTTKTKVVLRRVHIDGFYMSDYSAPTKSAAEKNQEELLALAKKSLGDVSGGEGWKDADQ